MFIESTIIGIIIGFVRGGRLSNIGGIHIRGWTFMLIGFFLQILPTIFGENSFVSNYWQYLYVLSVMLIVATLLLNIRSQGFWVILFGAMLNYIVIFINGFKMPIYIDGLQVAGLKNFVESINNGDILNYMYLSDSIGWTKYLGKFIVIPKPYPLAKVISIGDLLISLGIILYLNGIMNRSYLSMRGRMFSMGYRTKSRYKY